MSSGVIENGGAALDGPIPVRAARVDRIAPRRRLVDWLLRGDRRRPEGPREWDDAVRLLRAAWREPSRRELVRRGLRAVASRRSGWAGSAPPLPGWRDGGRAKPWPPAS